MLKQPSVSAPLFVIKEVLGSCFTLRFMVVAYLVPFLVFVPCSNFTTIRLFPICKHPLFNYIVLDSNICLEGILYIAGWVF